MTILFDKTNDQFKLGIKPDGIPAIEILLTTRYYHYILIANFPENQSKEIKLQQLINKAIFNGRTPEIKEGNALFLKTEDDIRNEIGYYNFSQTPSLAYKLNLHEMRLRGAQFLFYRVAQNLKTRKKYQDYIESEIRAIDSKAIAKVNLFKPNIPLIFVDRTQFNHEQNYCYYSPISKIYHRYSCFAHDYSHLIFGLARSYIFRSNVSIFSDKKYTKDFLEIRRNFFRAKIFEEILQNAIVDPKENLMMPIDSLIIILGAMLQEEIEKKRKYIAEQYQPWYSDYAIKIVTLTGITQFIQCVKQLGEKVKELRTHYESKDFLKIKPSPFSRNKNIWYNFEILNDLLVLDATNVIELRVVPKLRIPGESKESYEIKPGYAWMFIWKFYKNIFGKEINRVCEELSLLQNSNLGDT